LEYWNDGFREKIKAHISAFYTQYANIPCGLQTKISTKITVIPIGYGNFDTLSLLPRGRPGWPPLWLLWIVIIFR